MPTGEQRNEKRGINFSGTFEKKAGGKTERQHPEAANRDGTALRQTPRPGGGGRGSGRALGHDPPSEKKSTTPYPKQSHGPVKNNVPGGKYVQKAANPPQTEEFGEE